MKQWWLLILTLMACTSKTVIVDNQISSALVSMKELGKKDRLAMIKKIKTTKYCAGDEITKEPEGGKVTAFFDEAITRFQEEHRADAIGAAKIKLTSGAMSARLCAEVKGYPVRIKNDDGESEDDTADP